MSEVFIGLGSNLNNPPQQLKHALHELNKLGKVLVISSCYESEPWGEIQDQSNFLNVVAKLQIDLNPWEFLSELQLIEKKHKRVRMAERNGPRTLDLDILLFGQLELESSQLTIPHRYLTEREFVVYPLYEIEPDLILPNGQALATLVKQLPKRGLKKYENSSLSRDF